MIGAAIEGRIRGVSKGCAGLHREGVASDGCSVVSGPVTRRRGQALERALLDAAWAELAEAGYPNLTMEGVAARARTSKPVLYRRWPTRAELVIAAVRAHLPDVTPTSIPDTGSLRGDLVAALTVASRWHSGPVRQALHGVMSDLYTDPQLSALLQPDILGTAAKVMPVILQRASDRGEVDPDQITPRVAMLPFALFRHELLTSSAPIPATTLTEIIDDVFLPLVRRTAHPAAADLPTADLRERSS
jgi:AcrR family transcriptional regulator